MVDNILRKSNTTNESTDSIRQSILDLSTNIIKDALFHLGVILMSWLTLRIRWSRWMSCGDEVSVFWEIIPDRRINRGDVGGRNHYWGRRQGSKLLFGILSYGKVEGAVRGVVSCLILFLIYCNQTQEPPVRNHHTPYSSYVPISLFIIRDKWCRGSIESDFLVQGGGAEGGANYRIPVIILIYLYSY